MEPRTTIVDQAEASPPAGVMGGWRASAAVGAGGALGALLRHGANVTVGGWAGGLAATFCVNVVGALGLGVVTGMLASRPGLPGAGWVKQAVGVGLLGALTTFSTLSLEAVALFEEGRWAAAVGYGWGSIVAGLVAAAAGLWVGRRISGSIESAADEQGVA